MGVLDSAVRAAAKNVYRTFGKTMTLRRETGSAYDPATGSNVPTYTTYSVKGRVEDYEDRLIDGTLVKSGDRRVTFPAAGLTSGVEPLTTDQWVIGATTYAIVRVKATDATDEVAMWELQVRK